MHCCRAYTTLLLGEKSAIAEGIASLSKQICSQAYTLGFVELQQQSRGSTYSRERHNDRTFPQEVLAPVINTRIIQWSHFAAQGIDGTEIWSFATVAAETRVC